MVQALISAYGEDGAQKILKGIYDNAGDHLEESGSCTAYCRILSQHKLVATGTTGNTVCGIPVPPIN